MNILVTAAGSPGFITVQKAIHAAKGVPKNVMLHGCDINGASLGMKLADRSFIAPRGDSDDYITELLSYCRKNNIDLLIPCADEELLPLATNKHLFEEMGCKVLVSGEASIRTALNKSRLFQFCANNHLSEYIVEYSVCNNVEDLLKTYYKMIDAGLKVCVKPTKAHGSRGFRVIEPLTSKSTFFNSKAQPNSITIDSLCEILGNEEFPELLIMEYLPGSEYSVDCFKRDGDFLCVPRTREIIKEGICVAGKVVKNEALMHAANKIYNKIGLSYNANIQFRYNEAGRPVLLEINPRFSGTMEHCRAAGVNFVEVAIRNILNLEDLDYKIKWNVAMTRVWNEIFQDENGLYTLGENNE
tara:strand:- start:1006 stop:2076 length:1071 start_codon:yes stop_codon:yes gene_type:complete